MKTDQDLKFHRGQEFTKKDNSRVHCIIQSYIDSELSYLVKYTCSGHSKKISESDLCRLYSLSTKIEKQNALKRMNQNSTNHEDDDDEDGSLLSPTSSIVKR